MTTQITPRDAQKEFSLPTGSRHSFNLKRFLGFVLEVRDVHYHLDSAVFLPCAADADLDLPDAPIVTGLAALRGCYRQAEAHPAQKLLILGHADTSGPADYNLTLSQQRASSVRFALLGKRDDWVKLSDEKHKVRDYQLILKWVSRVWAADCDPGVISDKHDAPTQQAVLSFQQMYNAEFSAEGASIGEDGLVGPETWGAFFDIYMEVLADICNIDATELDSLRAKVKFLDDGKASVGCGEHFPVDRPGSDGFQSRANRRVEMIFFDPGEEPKLDCHPSEKVCKPKLCEVNASAFFTLTHIAPPPAALLPRMRLKLEKGDLDALFTPIAAEVITDPGVRERLQAVGFLYEPLNSPQIATRAREAWAHFKEENSTPTDAAAVAELKSLLKTTVIDGDALPAKGDFGKLRLPGTYCVLDSEPAFWGTNGARNRFTQEQRVWRANPSLGLIPIAVQVEAKMRKSWKVAGGVRVHFQLVEPDDIPAGNAVASEPLRSTSTVSTTTSTPPLTFTMTGSPDKYVKDTRALNPEVALDPQKDNVHQTKGGKRGNPTAGTNRLANVLEVGGARPAFNGASGLALKATVASPHVHAVAAESNAQGKAAAVLMPSFMGGDRYKVKVFIDPLRSDASDGSGPDAVVDETGTMVVWRILRVSKYLRWNYPASATALQQSRCGGPLDDFDLAVWQTELKKAWLDVTLEAKAQGPTPITAAEWVAAVRFARTTATPATTQRYDLTTLIPDTGPTAGAIRFLSPAQYDAATKSTPAPPGGWPSAVSDPNLWGNLSNIFHDLKTEFLSFFTKNAIGGATVIQAPAVASYLHDPPPGRPLLPWANSGWGTSRRGCWVIFGHNTYFNGTFPYDHTRNGLHELGHVFYGVHQYTQATQVNVNTGGTLDGHDYHDLCIMGYMPCSGGFCGRCVLNMAGWDTGTLLANSPGP